MVTASPFEADEEVALKLIEGPGIAGGAVPSPPPPPPHETIKTKETTVISILFIEEKF